MPNLGSAIKDEVTRLARKEIRKEVENLKSASTRYRSEIADLKRRLTGLEKGLARLDGKRAKATDSVKTDLVVDRIRFSAKGFATHRQRLGLSAAETGALVGVSGATIYSWESGKTKPRQSQLGAIATLRKMGKRQAKAALEGLVP